MTTPFIEALRRISDLTKEWPGDDEAPRVIGTVNAIAFGALLAVTEGTKPQQEASMKYQFEIDMHIDLHDGCGVFANDVECVVTIDYEVDHYRDGDYTITDWRPVDIRFPNVPGATTAKSWLWPMFERAVMDKAKFIDGQIRARIEEDLEEWAPSANLMSAVS
jgi:hypothetical protein